MSKADYLLIAAPGLFMIFVIIVSLAMDVHKRRKYQEVHDE